MRSAVAGLVLMLGLLFAVTAIAQQAPEMAAAPPAGDSLRVSVLTFAPGLTYWQRFGHNALLVETTATGANAVYNYGMFDFFQKNFFLNFARGHMLYRLDVDSLERTLALYANEGRWVRQQVLNLDSAQRLEIARALDRNAQPDQAQYRYDYFRDNCSTRVRDAVNRVLGGALQAPLEAQAAGVSYRYEATRLVTPIPLLMAGMDLIMGPAGDVPLNLWQQSFVPEVFMQALRTQRVDGQPVVLQENALFEDARSPVAPAAPLDLLPLTLALGLLLGAALPLLAARRDQLVARVGFAGIATALMALCTLGGLISLAVWTLTEHWVMWANRNLLLLPPLALLLLPAAIRSVSAGWQPRRWHANLAVVFALAALLTLPLSLLPGAQQHWTWIALLLPMQLGFAVALRRLVKTRY